MIDINKEVVIERWVGDGVVVAIGYLPDLHNKSSVKGEGDYRFPRRGALQVSIIPKGRTFSSVRIPAMAVSGDYREYGCGSATSNCFALVDRVDICDLATHGMRIKARVNGGGDKEYNLKPNITYIVTYRTIFGLMFRTDGWTKVKADVLTTPLCRGV